MSSIKTGGVWLIGHASRFVPALVIAAVLALTWQTLRQVHPQDVVERLHAMHAPWLLAAAAITLLNIAVMGLYDVIAFSHTRTRAIERWRYGAVAFAWSNFLTLGPFAGPAIRFWLYRPAVEHSSDLETGVLSITIAFASGLVGWTLATFIVPTHSTVPNAVMLTMVAAALVYGCVYAGRFAAVRIERFDEIDPSPRAALGPALIGWLDWLLAGLAFLACLHATGAIVADVISIRKFFLSGRRSGSRASCRAASAAATSSGSRICRWRPACRRRRSSRTGSCTTSCRGRPPRSCCCRGRPGGRRAAWSSRGGWWPGWSRPAACSSSSAPRRARSIRASPRSSRSCRCRSSR